MSKYKKKIFPILNVKASSQESKFFPAILCTFWNDTWDKVCIFWKKH